VRRAIARLEPLIELHPGYKVYAHYGPAMVELLKGNAKLALEHIDRALAMVQAGRHPTWASIASSRVEILMHLEQNEEAKRDGEKYLEASKAAGLCVMEDRLSVPLALAEAKLGEFNAAVERLERVIHGRNWLSSTGLNLGWAYEVRARIAIWMRDQVGFARAAMACAREYGLGRGGSTFAPKYEALRAEARQAGLTSASELPPAASPDTVASYLSTLSGNTAVEDRMSLALALIVSAAGARSGALYRLHTGPLGANDESFSIERCACTFEGELPEQAPVWVSSMLSAALSDDDATAGLTVDEAGASRGGLGHWIPIPLGCTRAGRYERTGAALLWFDSGLVPKVLSRELVEVVGHLLAS
jgi:tetratricopeptide (TPR) repeat protein